MAGRNLPKHTWIRHRVATGIALAREGAFDAEHAERFADPRVVELAATFGMEKVLRTFSWRQSRSPSLVF